MTHIAYTLGTMFLSGNLFLILFLFVDIICKRFITPIFKDFMIKINLLIFIIPISYFVYTLKLLLFVLNGSYFEETPFFLGDNPTIIFTPNKIFINDFFILFIVCLLIWIVLSGVFMPYHILKYKKMKNYLCSRLNPINDSDFITYSEEIKSIYRINKKVVLYSCDVISSACTFGFLKHVVILPKSYSNKDLKIMICHELTHIKHHDPIFRFIRLICLGLYWFNPLMYLLSNRYDITSELACDEHVIKNLNLQDKRRYAELIIEAASSNTSTYNRYTNYFSKNANYIKERIDCIMTNSQTSIFKKVIMSALIIFMTSICFLPAFAAPVPQMINVSKYSSSDAVSYDSTSNYSFDFRKGNSASVISIIYDEQFVSETGEISMVTPKDKNARVNCTHTYVNGIYTIHTKTSNGGCTVKQYNAQQCTKCGTFAIGTLISTTNYVACSH